MVTLPPGPVDDHPDPVQHNDGPGITLCIADPPYLGRSHWYTDGGRKRTVFKRNGTMNAPADHHPDAAVWDDPATHVALVHRLQETYDGWAIAMSRDSLPVYLSAAPTAHVAVWHNPASWPPGGAIHASWEPVLVKVPRQRKNPVGRERVRDVLTAVPPRRYGFIGAKPPAWTRWVLEMLGYDPATDQVHDMFTGSGAVSAEIAQGTLL